MEAVTLFGNLTIMFVIELLFAQQDYRTIHFLSEERHNEFSNEIIQIASNSLKPITHSVFCEVNIKRGRSEEAILNVVFLNYLHNETNVGLVRGNIFSDDVTLLLPIQNVDEISDVYRQMWMNLSSRVILLTRNLTIFFNYAFENDFSSKIDLSRFDLNSTRSLIENISSVKYLPRRQRDFTLFFQFTPPKSTVGTFGQNFVLIGPDGSIAEAIVKALKVKPIFSSDIARWYPTYESWGDDPVISARMIYQSYYPRVMTKNFLKIFNNSLSGSMDLHLSPFPYSLNGERMQLKTESLYPHDRDCLVVMVPKQLNSKHFLEKITREPDIQSICLALILFAIVRMIIGKSSWRQCISILIKSLGIFLNQAKLPSKTKVEVAWDMNLRGFSVLATIALSVIIYKNLMSKKYLEIDTIDDLIASNMTILAPDYFQNDKSFWSNLKPELHTKITFKGINDINFDVVTRRKFNYAYVLTDSGAEYMDMLLHTYISSANSYKRMIRVMNEKLYCRLSSYRISRTSPLKTYVNDFVRRFVENGLYGKHLEWMRQLNSDVFQVNKYKTTRSDGTMDPVVLDIDLMFGIFALYIVGAAISVVIFLFELKI